MTVMHLAKFLRNKMDVPSKYKVKCPCHPRQQSSVDVSDCWEGVTAISGLYSWACRNE